MNTYLSYHKVLALAQGNPTPARPAKVIDYPIQAGLAAIPVEAIDSGELNWFAQMVADAAEAVTDFKRIPGSFSFEFCGGLCSEDEDFDASQIALGPVPDHMLDLRFGNTVHDMGGDFWLVKWYDEGINGHWLFKLVAQCT